MFGRKLRLRRAPTTQISTSEHPRKGAFIAWNPTIFLTCWETWAAFLISSTPSVSSALRRSPLKHSIGLCWVMHTKCKATMKMIRNTILATTPGKIAWKAWGSWEVQKLQVRLWMKMSQLNWLLRKILTVVKWTVTAPTNLRLSFSIMWKKSNLIRAYKLNFGEVSKVLRFPARAGIIRYCQTLLKILILSIKGK